jgi:protein ImuB
MVAKVRGASGTAGGAGSGHERGHDACRWRAVLPEPIVADMDRDADAHWLMRLARR